MSALDRVRARRKSPERDPLLAAICTACKVDRSRFTDYEREAFDFSVSMLIKQGATPRNVPKRAERFRYLYPGVRLTVSALDRAWPMLG